MGRLDRGSSRRSPSAAVERDLLAGCIRTSIHTHKFIAENIAKDPDAAFALQRVPGKGPEHVTTVIDIKAQKEAERFLVEYMDRKCLAVWTEGEETRAENRPDFEEEKRPGVILDMIDGTDLLTREFGNWCSAMLAFHPPTAEILAVVLGIPLGNLFKLYVATRSQRGARLLVHDICYTELGAQYYARDPEGTPLKPLPYEPAPGKLFDDVSLCFYGQKLDRLRDPSLLKLWSLLASTEPARCRVYTLAGNPMLSRLAEGRITAVLELKGQLPHDCVPGIFLAQKAGAHVAAPSGKELDLGAHTKGRTRLAYVAASDRKMFDVLVERL